MANERIGEQLIKNALITPEQLLEALSAGGALAAEGLLVIEHEREAELSHPEWNRTDCRPYGDTALSFFARRVR